MNNEELIAKIKAEIERRIRLYDMTNEKEAWIIITYKAVLSFLDTLESEKTMDQDGLEGEIEMEWDSFNKHLAEYNDDDSDEVIWLNKFSFTDIARHFAEWGADHAPLPEDTILFNKGVEEGKRLMIEDYPKWHKVQRGSCFDKHTNFILSAREGHFYCSSMEVQRDGYILLVDELERLPKEDEK